jgi:choline dehydrogenase-like flavoprotein
MATRDWLPHSGWPFRRSVLDPYYERARAFCGVARQGPDLAEIRAAGVATVPWSEPLETAVWQVSPARPFGAAFRSELADAAGLTVLLHANLVQLVVADDGRSIVSARLETLGKVQLTVTARRYVLACGGIENARLLLAMASEHHPAGLGNQYDLVGRFFAEHPELSVGMLIHNRPAAVKGHGHVISTAAGQMAEGFRLNEDIQRTEQIADVAFWPLSNAEINRSSAPPELALLVQDTSSRLSDLRPYGPRVCTFLTVSFEQSPNPDSRITLCDRRDALGMRRARLEWRLNDTDRRTFATALKVIAREAGRQRVGRFWLRPQLRDLDLDHPETVSFALPLSAPSTAENQLDTELRWGCHHLGTTRMHLNPREGVVDPQARVHGVTNLYIAGSSIFPNAGISNPTLTIIALALKLADHLRTTIQ